MPPSGPNFWRNANPNLSSGGTQLARVRLSMDVSQTQLAERSGVSLTTLQRIERGVIANPGVRQIVALADALGCSVDELIDPSWRRAQPQR